MKQVITLFLLPFCLCLVSLAAEDRVQMGQDVTIEAHETVGDAVCIGCSIRVRGKVTGDAVAIGGNIEVDGSVGVDAVAIEGNVSLGPGAVVGSDVVALGGRIQRDPQAQVGSDAISPPGLATLLLLGLLGCAVINIIFVVLCYLVAGAQRVQNVAETVRQRGGLAFLTGLGVVAGAVILFIIATLSGPATPIIAILVSVVLFLTVVLGYTGLSSWLGHSLVRKAGPLAALLIGALLITVIQLVPLLGFLAFLVFMLLALGSAALSGYGTSTDWLSRRLSAQPPVRPAPPAAPQ